MGRIGIYGGAVFRRLTEEKSGGKTILSSLRFFPAVFLRGYR